ncbi:major tail protein [Acinetobacter sp.]|uniref:major tail protein n=1 Tax=Acinetobacter sp. TaxID=472 RepID=UPI003D070F0D
MSDKHATVGVEMLHYAIATVAADGTVTYDLPVKISDAQKITITPKTTTDKYYADDTTADIVNSFDGCDVGIETYGIKNEILAALEGHEVDANGVVIENANDEPPYIALGFRSRKRNGKYRYIWLLLGKKKPGNEEYETIKEKQEPKSAVMPFEFVQCANGNWRYKIDEDDPAAPIGLETKWFAKVYDGSFPA